MNRTKMIVFMGVLLAVVTLLAGCGENETNEPSTKLTASVVASLTDVTGHTHTVSIPFSDFSATSAADMQYRTDVVDGHSHVIALSAQQLQDLNNGMRVEITSSSPDVGVDHSHDWSIQGGDLLYEKYCYNCHTDDKRGHNPMNVTFNSSQVSAVKSPTTAPLSTGTVAVPDPAYTPPTQVSIDGVALYAANCSSCHGALATSTKANRSFAQIQNAISANLGGMSSLGALTDAQLQAIADALVQ